MNPRATSLQKLFFKAKLKLNEFNFDSNLVKPVAKAFEINLEILEVLIFSVH